MKLNHRTQKLAQYKVVYRSLNIHVCVACSATAGSISCLHVLFEVNSNADAPTQTAANQEAFQSSFLPAAYGSVLPRPNTEPGGMDNR